MFTKIDPRKLERISGGILPGGCVGPFPRPQPELPTGTGPTFPQLPLPGGSQPIR
jgi:hypothetical protein